MKKIKMNNNLKFNYYLVIKIKNNKFSKKFISIIFF